MKRLLVIDDESQMRKLLQMTFSPIFECLNAETGQEGLQDAISLNPDLIILDLGLPDISGMEVLKKLRLWNQEIAILILSAEGDPQVIVEALNTGADDYVTKPFDINLLLARVNVCLRRSKKLEIHENIILGNLEINLEQRVVTRNGIEIHLTATEYELLKFFLMNRGKVLTTKQILKQVWGPSVANDSQYPKVYVRYLRQKIEDDPNQPKFILTESGVGYRMK